MKTSQLLSMDGLDQLFPVHEYFQVLNRDVTLIVEENLPGPSDRLFTILARAKDDWRDVLAEHCTGDYTKELHLPVDFVYLADETWRTGHELLHLLGISHHPTDVAICGNYVYISMYFGA
jgi:hypothetical protein